jgi:hypothetical protein
MDAELTLTVSTLSDKRVRLSGTTNLPSETILMLRVREETANGFYGQSKCIVSAKGTFESDLFGPPGGLKDGLYEASALMLPRLQSSAVRAVIGNYGEKLKGDLITMSYFYVGVTQSAKFAIGGASAAQAQAERAKQADADGAGNKPTFRTWSDSSGRFKTEAILVAIEDGHAILKKQNGSTVKVPLNRLSDADKDFVEQQRTSR